MNSKVSDMAISGIKNMAPARPKWVTLHQTFASLMSLGKTPSAFQTLLTRGLSPWCLVALLDPLSQRGSCVFETCTENTTTKFSLSLCTPQKPTLLTAGIWGIMISVIINPWMSDVAGMCEVALQYGIKTYVDEMGDAVSNAYASLPDRLYLVGQTGKVVYAGGRGPFGFKPAELKEAIEKYLLEINI